MPSFSSFRLLPSLGILPHSFVQELSHYRQNSNPPSDASHVFGTLAKYCVGMRVCCTRRWRWFALISSRYPAHIFVESRKKQASLIALPRWRGEQTEHVIYPANRLTP